MHAQTLAKCAFAFETRFLCFVCSLSLLNQVRVAAWRLNSAQVGALHGGNLPRKTTRGGAARRSDEVDPLIQSRETRRTSAAKGEARGGPNDDDEGSTAAAAESTACASEVVVGKVRVTAAMARLKGLDLNALAQRFDRPPEKKASDTKSGSSNNVKTAKDAQAKDRGGDVSGGRSGSRSRVEASNRQHLSRDFAKLSDAKHCTFKPRGKSPARRAAARAAGFTVKDDNNNSGVDEDAFGGFRPLGSGPTRAEIEVIYGDK